MTNGAVSVTVNPIFLYQATAWVFFDHDAEPNRIGAQLASARFPHSAEHTTDRSANWL
jgi:hypothetical protein